MYILKTVVDIVFYVTQFIVNLIIFGNYSNTNLFE